MRSACQRLRGCLLRRPGDQSCRLRPGFRSGCTKMLILLLSVSSDYIFDIKNIIFHFDFCLCFQLVVERSPYNFRRFAADCLKSYIFELSHLSFLIMLQLYNYKEFPAIKKIRRLSVNLRPSNLLSCASLFASLQLPLQFRLYHHSRVGHSCLVYCLHYSPVSRQRFHVLMCFHDFRRDFLFQDVPRIHPIFPFY